MPANVTQFREEYIAQFKERGSYLRDLVTTEAVIKGNQATFLVAGYGNAVATTRSAGGDIVYQSTSNEQLTATLSERHAAFEKNNFNIFAEQGDQRNIMYEESRAVLNVNIDQTIIDSLNAGTNAIAATAQKGSLEMLLRAQGILGNNFAMGNDLSCLISPAFYGYLSQLPNFTSVDYGNDKRLSMGVQNKFSWLGMTFVVHTQLPNAGTASETCFMFSKRAIGHAADTDDIKFAAGYEDKHDRSYVRSTLYHGATLLQNGGVIKMLHDGSEFAAVTV